MVRRLASPGCFVLVWFFSYFMYKKNQGLIIVFSGCIRLLGLVPEMQDDSSIIGSMT